ncbi:O-antigen ligase family protein [Dongshaea marina]|uniref:O-antigen ligase family protein n=1 Tax=Dongshaea marina TaxID=2047966 RepID=UPI00131F0DA1|nr:pilin glycosylation ligase domain-containing protein [Dongshaea marina]
MSGSPLFSPRALFVGCLSLYLLIGVHFYMANPGGSGLYLPYNIVGWCFVSLLISFGCWQLVRTRELIISPLHLLGWLAFILLCIPIAYPNVLNIDYALPRLLGLGGGLALYFALLQFRFTPAQLRSGLYLVLGCAAIELVLGMVQYFVLTPGNWLGYNTLANRPYGIFQQPNVMASFVATSLGISLYLCGQLPGKQLKLWQLMLHGWVIIAGVLLLVVLQSRTGQAGGILAVVLLLPLVVKKAPVRARNWLFAALLGIGLGIASYYGVAGSKRPDTIYTQPGLRAVIYSQSIDLFTEQPWLGAGYGNFERAFVLHYAKSPDRKPEDAQILQGLTYPHDELLYWAVEGGSFLLWGSCW